MAREIRTEITIRAPVERVWSILTDFPAYPSWNPFVRSIAGRLTAGERLTVELRSGERSTMRFRPRVLTVDPGRELRWLGRLIVPGLFDGEHGFRLHPEGPEAVRFTQSESFRGLLVPLLWSRLDRETRAEFEAMNRALAQRAERP